jgi:hypothetical protein
MTSILAMRARARFVTVAFTVGLYSARLLHASIRKPKRHERLQLIIHKRQHYKAYIITDNPTLNGSSAPNSIV